MHGLIGFGHLFLPADCGGKLLPFITCIQRRETHLQAASAPNPSFGRLVSTAACRRRRGRKESDADASVTCCCGWEIGISLLPAQRSHVHGSSPF